MELVCFTLRSLRQYCLEPKRSGGILASCAPPTLTADGSLIYLGRLFVSGIVGEVKNGYAMVGMDKIPRSAAISQIFLAGFDAAAIIAPSSAVRSF